MQQWPWLPEVKESQDTSRNSGICLWKHCIRLGIAKPQNIATELSYLHYESISALVESKPIRNWYVTQKEVYCPNTLPTELAQMLAFKHELANGITFTHAGGFPVIHTFPTWNNYLFTGVEGRLQWVLELVGWNGYTGQIRYVKLAYLENTTCVEAMFPLPNIIPYVLLYLNLVCVKLAYLENLPILKWFSFPLISFPLVLLLIVSKSKVLFRKWSLKSSEQKLTIFARYSTARHFFLILHIGKNVIKENDKEFYF